MRRVAPLVLASLVGSALLFATQSTPAKATTGADSPAWAAATQCMAAQNGVQVQIVVDESSSLVHTDPGRVRDQLVKGWLTDLLGYASGSNEVRVALGGYGTQWQDLLPWTTLDQGTIGPAFAAVDALSTREEDTDHVLAIKRAAQSLDQETARVHAAGRTPCPMVLWFTDGKYEFGSKSQQYRRSLGLPATTEYSNLPVNSKNDARIMSQGLRYLCGVDGPVMSLRTQRTAFLAVALNLKLDFGLVKEIATGDGYSDNATGQDCLLPHYDQGDQGSVDPGSTLTTVSTTATSPATSSPTSCDAAPSSCTTEVTVHVPSLADVAQIRLSAGSADGGVRLTSVRITAPDGATASADHPVASGTQLVVGTREVALSELASDVALVGLHRKPTVSIDGLWRFSVSTDRPGLRVTATTVFSSNLTARLQSPDSVLVGSRNTAVIALVDPDRGTLDPALLRTFQAAVSFPALADSTPVNVQTAPDGSLQVSIPAEAIATNGEQVEMAVAFSVTQPVRVATTRIAIPIRRPEFPTLVFPKAQAGVVSPATFDSPGKASVEYDIKGPERGRGCVNPTTSSFTYDGGRKVTLTYSQPGNDCVGVGDAQFRELTVSIPTRHQGRVCGSLAFQLTGTESATSRTFTQPICLYTERSANLLTRLLAVLMGLLGLLPLVVLGLLNRWNGRLPGALLSVADIDVNIVQEPIRRPGGELLLNDADFSSSSIDAGSHRLSVADVGVVIEARAASVPRLDRRGRPSPSMLLSGPRNYLVAVDGSVIVGDRDKIVWQGQFTGTVRLPRNLDGVWILVARDPAAANLVVLRVQGAGFTLANLRDQIFSATGGGAIREFREHLQPTKDEPIDSDV